MFHISLTTNLYSNLFITQTKLKLTSQCLILKTKRFCNNFRVRISVLCFFYVLCFFFYDDDRNVNDNMISTNTNLQKHLVVCYVGMIE